MAQLLQGRDDLLQKYNVQGLSWGIEGGPLVPLNIWDLLYWYGEDDEKRLARRIFSKEWEEFESFATWEYLGNKEHFLEVKKIWGYEDFQLANLTLISAFMYNDGTHWKCGACEKCVEEMRLKLCGLADKGVITKNFPSLKWGFKVKTQRKGLYGPEVKETWCYDRDDECWIVIYKMRGDWFDCEVLSTEATIVDERYVDMPWPWEESVKWPGRFWGEDPIMIWIPKFDHSSLSEGHGKLYHWNVHWRSQWAFWKSMRVLYPNDIWFMQQVVVIRRTQYFEMANHACWWKWNVTGQPFVGGYVNPYTGVGAHNDPRVSHGDK